MTCDNEWDFAGHDSKENSFELITKDTIFCNGKNYPNERTSVFPNTKSSFPNINFDDFCEGFRKTWIYYRHKKIKNLYAFVTPFLRTCIVFYLWENAPVRDKEVNDLDLWHGGPNLKQSVSTNMTERGEHSWKEMKKLLRRNGKIK